MPHLTMCMIHPQSVEEATHVKNLYRAQLARVVNAISNIEEYYNDHMRHVEKYGEKDASRDSYFFKVQNLIMLYHDLNYQEAYHTSLKDGSINYFYRSAYTALISGEIVCELENKIQSLNSIARGLDRGRNCAIRKKKSSKTQTDTEILAALRHLYDGGARYVTLDPWANEVIKMLPHLKGRPNATLNDTISKLGREEFGVDWPVKPRGRRKSSQFETNYSRTD